MTERLKIMGPDGPLDSGAGMYPLSHGEEHLNTSVVHIRDHRFPKHTLIAISHLKEKYSPEKRVILPQNLPISKIFFEKTCFADFEK